MKETDNKNITKELIDLYSKQEFDEVIKLGSNFLKNKSDKKIINVVAASYDHKGDSDKAIKLYKENIKEFPDFYPSYKNIALILIRKTDYNDAITYLIKARELETNDESIDKPLAQSYQAIGENEKAAKVYEDILSYNYKSNESLYNLGNIHLKSNNLEKAEDYYERALELRIHPYILINLAALKQRLEKYDQAIILLEELIKIQPDNVNAHNNLGSVYLTMEENEKALKHLEDALKLDENFLSALNNISNVHMNLNNFEDAIKTINKAINITPSFKLYSTKGHLNLLTNDIDLAIDSFNKALDLDDNQINTYINISACHQKKGNIEKAVNILKTAIDKFSNDPLPHLYLADVCVKNQLNKEMAKNAIEKAEKLGGVNYNNTALRIKGNFLRASNNYKEAVKTFEQRTDDQRYEDIIWSLFLDNDLKEIASRIEEYSENDKESRSISAFATHLAEMKLKENNYNNFCKNPLDFIYHKQIKDSETSNKKITSNLIKVYEEETFIPRSQSYLINGEQSSGDIFAQKRDDKTISELNEIIHKHIEQYKEKFNQNSNIFIENFPNNGTLVGWFINTEKEGYLDRHFHENGWVSGVVYLDVPKRKKNEGSIEFSLCADIKQKTKNSKIIDVSSGDIVIFPSSLWHSTIPIMPNERRLILAFDYQPLATGKSIDKKEMRVNLLNG